MFNRTKNKCLWMYTMKVNSGFSTEYWKTLTLWNLATLRIWLGAHEHDWNEIPRNRREETKPIRYNNKKKTRFAVVLFDLFNKWNGNDTPKQTRCFFFLYEESARVYWTIVVCVCATTLAWQSFFFFWSFSKRCDYHNGIMKNLHFVRSNIWPMYASFL